MEFDTKSNDDPNHHQPFALSNNNFLKPEIEEEEFCMDSFEDESKSSFLQDFQHLDHFSFTESTFNPDLGVQTNGFDPFDPFSNGSSPSDIDFLEFKPFDEEENHENNGNINSSSAMQNSQGGDQFIKYTLNKTPFHQNFVPSNNNISIPDESSCVTADSGFYKENGVKISSNTTSNNGSFSSPKKAGRGRKKSKSAKGQWTIEEDRLLINLVEKFGVRKWSHIAQMLKGRIGKQCRERWHNHLRPDIKKDIWTEEEDRILIQTHAEVGNKWAEIAKRLPGRTENSIKNHWNATKRRQFSRRKCRTKWPRPSSLLQNYIKTLNFEEGSNKRNINNNASANDASTINNAPTPAKQEMIDFCPDDQTLADYEFIDVLDFVFDDKLFDGRSIDSFIDDIPTNAPPFLDEDKILGMEISFDFNVPSLMQCEVKKELDLMEMISQVGL